MYPSLYLDFVIPFLDLLYGNSSPCPSVFLVCLWVILFFFREQKKEKERTKKSQTDLHNGNPSWLVTSCKCEKNRYIIVEVKMGLLIERNEKKKFVYRSLMFLSVKIINAMYRTVKFNMKYFSSTLSVDKPFFFVISPPL